MYLFYEKMLAGEKANPLDKETVSQDFLCVFCFMVQLIQSSNKPLAPVRIFCKNLRTYKQIHDDDLCQMIVTIN